MTKYANPGHTFALYGTLLAETTLVAKAGNTTRPGGVIDVASQVRATNDGTIDLLGSNSAPTTGGALLIQGYLINHGIITAGGGYDGGAGGSLHVDGVLANSGTLTFGAGLNGPGAQGLISADATLIEANVLIVQAGIDSNSAGATLTDAGLLSSYGYRASLVVDSGAAGALLAVTGTLTTGASTTVTVYGGVVTPRDPHVSGTLSISGVLDNGGTINLAVGSMSSNYYGNGGLLTDSGTLTNTGVIIAPGGQSTFFAGPFAGYGATIDVSGVLTNQGLLMLGGGFGTAGQGYFYPSFGAILNDTGLINNSGSIMVEGYGGRRFPGYYYGSKVDVATSLSNLGSITVDEGSSVDVAGTGAVTNTGDITLQGGQSYLFYTYPSGGFGAALDMVGTMSNRGTLTVGGGHSGYVQYFGGSGSKYYFGVGGAGATAFIAGTLTNTGTINVGGGGGVYSGIRNPALGTGGVLDVTGVVTNRGTIALQEAQASQPGIHAGTGGYGLGARLLDAGTLTDNGLISIAAGPGAAAATLQVAGVLQGGGTIINAGIVNSGARNTTTGVITVPTFINTGSIVSVQNGALTIDSAISGQGGTLDIRADATLTLNGAVAATQTVVFAGADHSDLAIGDIGAFAGTIDGLTSATSIDFLRLDVTTATTTGAALEITLASGAAYTLALGAPLAPLSLHLVSDTHGGTDLLVQPPTSI